MNLKLRLSLFLVLSFTAMTAQESPSLDAQGIRMAVTAGKEKALPADATPTPKAKDQPEKTTETSSGNKSEFEIKIEEQRRLNFELKGLKAKDQGPLRFAEDLFEFREDIPDTSEGGISDEYVLGIGDKLTVAGFGSATFDFTDTVDGRGQLTIPKVGTVKIGGLSLGNAKSVIQSKVNQELAGTRVDIKVTKLREIRVFIMGEVYRPGTYMVPSLSSIVNILSKSGGPTRLGSFRDIRVMRGGQILMKLDLYPLRMDGQGNLNVFLQTGDTIFVPLVKNAVILEGAFVRIAKILGLPKTPEALNINPESAMGAQMPNMMFEMLPEETAADAVRFAGGLLPAGSGQSLSLCRKDVQGLTSVQDLPISRLAEVKLLREDILTAFLKRDRTTSIVNLAGWVRVPGVYERREGLRLAELLQRDKQILPDTYLERAELVRTKVDGSTSYHHINVRLAMEGNPDDNILLEDRDQIEVFRRQRLDPPPAITFQDPFSNPVNWPLHEGMRVADLIYRSGIPKLKDGVIVLPEVYLRRGEIIRRDTGGTTTLFSFDVEKAFNGDPVQNLVLQDKDMISLFKIDRMRLAEKVTMIGPFTQAGTFELHKGMRVSDLVFKGGIPKLSANRYVAELARSQYGKPSLVTKLDLRDLISTEEDSPLKYEDDVRNPLLEADDYLTVYEKPEFRLHRIVKVLGQVAKPGSYILDTESPTISVAIARAGGLLSSAMPEAGIFLRNFSGGSEVENEIASSGSKGIADILERMNETKLIELKPIGAAASTGSASAPMLFKPPVMHGIDTFKPNRVVTDFVKALKNEKDFDLELHDGDEIIIPRKTDTAMVIGETTTPFAIFDVSKGISVSSLLKKAGGLTNNADKSNIRLLKANGMIFDSWVNYRTVEPGDTLLVPQRIRRDSVWQDSLLAMTPVALLINAFR